MSNAQISCLDEIIIDNFAGGGGASTGIELATGRPVTIAVNHDEAAIRMHRTNHPYTEHYQESVWNIDPVKVCAGRPVGLAWFSPDCKHFSKAKGAALVDRNIRGLAWIVLKWAGTVRPRVIILENVEEFKTWGPVRRGKPIKAKSGQTFEKWLSQLKALGYEVEYRELVAADYGAPTSRKRFFLVARCDGRPIVWPAPSHAQADSPEVISGEKEPWRAAAEIIDWSLPCPSIFDSKQDIKAKYGVSAVRPLADNTLKRITRGIDKFVIKNAQPFIVPLGYGERQGQAPRVNDIRDPLGTVVSSGKHYVCDPILTPCIAQHKYNNAAQNINKPLTTITSVGAHEVVAPKLAPYHMHNNQNATGTDMREPVNTITAAGQQMFIAPSLIQYHAEQSDYVRGQSLADKPLATDDVSNRYGLSLPILTQYFSPGQSHTPKDPLHTVTTRDREALVSVFLSQAYAGGYTSNGNAPSNPLNTVTASDHNQIVAAHIAEFKGQDKGQSVDNPLRTITASAGEYGTVKTYLTRIAPGADIKYWPKVRDMLNTYCDYHIRDDDVLILEINGVPYFISDIGLRMLTPRELYNAQGFPSDYIIDVDHEGKAYSRTDQVARCGNAVPPPFATALVRANLPEWCYIDVSTMYDLISVMAM